MPEVSEKGKGLFDKITGLFRGKQEGDSFSIESSSTKILSGIYKLLVLREANKMLNDDSALREMRADEIKEEKRHKEILKALTVKRPVKKTVQKKVEQETKKAKQEQKTKEAATPKPSEAPTKPSTKPGEPAPKAEAPKPEAKPKAEAPKPKAEAPKPKAEAPKPEVKPEAPKPTAEPVKPAEVPKPKVEPVKPVEAPKPKAEPVTPKVTKPRKRTAEMVRAAGVGVVSSLAAIGVSNAYAQKAILQTSYKESQIDVKSNESTAADYLATLNKRGYGYIQQTFPQLKPGGRLAKKLGYEKEGVPEEVVRNAMTSGNEIFYDLMYGGIMGNKDPGDGWKYRGRGLVAITGRSGYELTSKTLKEMGLNVDLVKNPDALTDPDVAYKAAAAYYANTLGGGNWKKGMEILNSYTDRDTALRDIIRATAGMGHKASDFEKGTGTGYEAKGSHLYVNYQRALAAAGEADKIMEMSGQNKDMKNTLNDQSAMSQTTNNVTVNNSSTNKTNSNKVDDRSAFDRKKTE